MKSRAEEEKDSDRLRQRFSSPLRYPGGKGKVANYLKLVMLENDLVGADYVEPYAGGASVALSLLFEEYADRVYINDLNRGVHAFWQAVLEQTEALCERIESADATVSEWQRQKSIYNDPDVEPLDLAFSTFFLNRTSRSGIIGGGIIGGSDQSGPWKADARFNRTELTRRIKKVARFRSRITLTQLDAAELLERDSQHLTRAFWYLDPPYYHKGPELYENSYSHEDHARIAMLTRSLASPWIVSYDAVPQIEELYPQSSRLRYGLNYSAAERQKGTEIMFFSSGLRMPNTESAAGIPREAVEEARMRLYFDPSLA